MPAPDPTPPAQPSGYWLILAAATLWGLIGIISKGILAEGVSPVEIAFWRALLGGLVFVVHGLAARRLRLHRAVDSLPLAGFAFVGVSLFFGSLILAIEAGGISLAFILLYSAPLFVLAAAWLVLGESLTLRKLILAPVAVAGIVLVSGSGGAGITVSAASLTWGLLSGLTYASYYIFGKLILARYRPVTIYAWVLPIGALGLLPFVSFASKSPTAWTLLVVLAVLSTYLAYLLYYSGLARVEASRAVLVATVEPVVALALAAALFGERFGPGGLLGAALILATAVSASLSTGKSTGKSIGKPTGNETSPGEGIDDESGSEGGGGAGIDDESDGAGGDGESWRKAVDDNDSGQLDPLPRP